MLNHRITAHFLAIALIAATMSVSTAPPAAADALNPCELAANAKAEDGNAGGKSSRFCPKTTDTGDSGSGQGAKAGSGTQADQLPEIDLADNVRQCHQVSRVSVIGPDKCDPPKAKAKPAAKQPTATQLRTVATQLQLPNPTPRFGPDPSVNEWKMLAVGFPIWLWTDRPTTVSTTAHHDGLTFTLTATWTSTTFTMGDGHSKTCTATTIRPKQLKPATKPSPTCSYTYQTKSKIGHPYTVTAHTHWRIDWTTNGYQGTFTHTYTGSRTLEIGELQSLING